MNKQEIVTVAATQMSCSWELEKNLSKAKKIGFILEGKVNMTQVQYEHQYLYFLKKPE